MVVTCCHMLSTCCHCCCCMSLYCDILRWNHLESYVAPDGLASRRPMPWRQRLKRPRARCGGRPAWRVAHNAGQKKSSGIKREWLLLKLLKRNCGPCIPIILAILSQGETTWENKGIHGTHFKQEPFASRLGHRCSWASCGDRLQSRWMQMESLTAFQCTFAT